MSKMKKSLSAMLLLSFLVSPVYGMETRNSLQSAALGTKKNKMLDNTYTYQNEQSKTWDNADSHSSLSTINKLALTFGLVGIGAAGLCGKYLYDRQVYKNKKLDNDKRFVLNNYKDIMGYYVKLDDDAEAGWSQDCDDYLIAEMAKTKDLLEYAKITYEKKLLFPITLLRIFDLNNVLSYLRDSGQDQVNIGLEFGEEDGFGLQLSDNPEMSGAVEMEILRDFSLGDFGAKCYMLYNEIPDFYYNILGKCESAVKNNVFLKEIFKKLIYIDFSIRKDGTLYCRTPECGHLADGSGYGLKLYFDYEF